ncbi:MULTISPECIES: tryptophan 2,3-dioxygenase family protein [Xanthomarina]|jgi:tryptophan 2,3-dioxygenase|uniref:Tryptophan 2,3-dioxygenase n=1 Tax=Xanthomarina gelatinilytica TaxID=1137281 RepID=M7MHM5_9FLAO|nr:MULTISPECIES: tryptophan 2,3-dioxygenase family protein [Xanthomarina]MCB0388719.1 tryptophan 2,3-dioxygenase [Winogradskyella sp.]EMQ95747.1 Tryptophan 2,3-dioxygenase [Xanthomarina gelatinilytica]MAL22291.1 tryptophan 2,3-dioxygenase [Xanthomarina sp.]MBF60829.1 tryptophan 2,3-dioxygenase [Xanthomarina sp.]MDX1316628.1 tryptophan 2,3-dioxygenase family protein [Xanthomarina gelatinilytica]|tara:strand:+ start:2413 stop:3336 length:924 start_codon:yes stop_codon:yes gene_type:complete
MELNKELTSQLKEKFDDLGQDLEVHLKGLLYSKPINYWDYIQTDALLDLQTQRTVLPDEMVFIMYHQINELLFKMILWEIDQVAKNENLDAAFFSNKLMRISRYFDMLTSSFEIMKDGMEVEQYNKFRNTLTPASGFQSAQYRKIEFASTELINLIDNRFRATIDRNTSFEHAFNHLYWQAAGKDYNTGKKSYLLTVFEERYKDEFIRFAKFYNTNNLWTKFKQLPQEVREDKELIKAMRHYDYTVNITWVMAHYNTANHYLNIGGKTAEATGGSEWVKYMHPKYQRRIFFPELWSEQELKDWGENV